MGCHLIVSVLSLVFHEVCNDFLVLAVLSIFDRSMGLVVLSEIQ